MSAYLLSTLSIPTTAQYVQYHPIVVVVVQLKASSDNKVCFRSVCSCSNRSIHSTIKESMAREIWTFYWDRKADTVCTVRTHPMKFSQDSWKGRSLAPKGKIFMRCFLSFFLMRAVCPVLPSDFAISKESQAAPLSLDGWDDSRTSQCALYPLRVTKLLLRSISNREYVKEGGIMEALSLGIYKKPCWVRTLYLTPTY